ncbi:VOC family protein [Alphaproteobacteria bacterium]|nr:VOC family protein [Alphaproteobacteria bacterium]
MKLEKIDHVVITVKDLNKTIDFYTNILGMKLEKFSSSLKNNQIRYAVSFGSQKINIHKEKKPLKPNALNPSSGSMDICFISQNKINDWMNHLEKKGINIEFGPEQKNGALGPILSIYIRDPDFNLIEISNQL